MALRWPTSGFALLSSSRASATRKTHPFLGSRPFAFPAAPLCVRSLHLSTTVAALPLPDPRVVSTSINASFSLISLCGFVILMQKYGHLPPNTAPVLSQVSFNLVIPCFLMSKVSKTIALQKDWRFLSLPLIALIQITIGGILGKLACIFLYKSSSICPSEGGNNGLLAKEALITTACAFGNTVTLPLVLMGILVGATPLSHLCLAANRVFDAEGTRGLLLSMYPLIASILQPIFEGANLLGSATVPLQTIVLASTLASSIGYEDDKERLVSRIEGAAASPHENYTANGIMLDGKAFWAITVIRLLVMPVIIFTLLIAFQHYRWLAADPLSQLILLVVAAMPTAQNLVVLAQLHANTRPFAGVLANILMRQYLISVVSLTVWLPIFCSFLRLG